MKRKFVTVAIAAGVTGMLVVTLGLVFQNQADFSRNYVHDQLAEHKITFSTVERLGPEQKQVPCLVANAGKSLTTGRQAECYANNQIAVDMTTIDSGKTYVQDHYAAFLLRQKTAEAVRTHPDDPATLALVKQSTDLSRKADDLLAGETMRGLLLTAYGFGLLGERGGQAATTCFAIGTALMLTMLASFALGARRKRRQAVEGTVDRTVEPSGVQRPMSAAWRGEPAMTGASGHSG
jgi:hypothetical protein